MPFRFSLQLVALHLLPLFTACASNSVDRVFGSASPEAREKGYVPIKVVQPKYPGMAARTGLEGCVTIAFDIRRDGKTDNFQVLDSKPKKAFEHAALLALRDWVFPPREEPARLTQRLDFARGEYDRDSPQCLQGDDIPEECLKPGESEPETGKPTLVHRETVDLPRRAIRRGITEGCVTLAFDVLPGGATDNIEVVGSWPPGVFDHAAIQAVTHWKYARHVSRTRVAERMSFGTVRASDADGEKFESRMRDIESKCPAESEVTAQYLQSPSR